MESATTTFFLLLAAKTITSAMSSGVSGSQPLLLISHRCSQTQDRYLLVYLVRRRFVAFVSYHSELLCVHQSRLHQFKVDLLTVSTCPGSTVMTLIRVSISSFRNASVNALTAALLAQ